jgi:hypothetical protein
MSITEVRVLAEAADELEAAAAFYDSREPGLGDEFWDVLLADIESLEDYAGIHAKHCGYHRMLAKRFPYAVYYRIHSDIAYVIAVLPLRRDPKWIARRLGRG